MQTQNEPPSVEIRCAFTRPVDPTLVEEVGRGLREFFQDDPGYVEIRHITVGWRSAPHMATRFRTIWASNAQADDAAARARDWRDSHEDRFGWETCDIEFRPEHTP